MRWLLIVAILLPLLLAGNVSAQAACATPAALAPPTAADDRCAFPLLIAAIDAEIGGSDTDRFTVGEASVPIDSKYLPGGWSDGATWRAELPAGGGAHWASLLEYESADNLARFRVEFELALKREFFVPAPVRSLDDPDACFTLLREESVRAICLFERDHRLIVGYSFFEIDTVDGPLATALAVARVVDSALVRVDGLG